MKRAHIVLHSGEISQGGGGGGFGGGGVGGGGWGGCLHRKPFPHKKPKRKRKPRGERRDTRGSLQAISKEYGPRKGQCRTIQAEKSMRSS